ncbi:MAG TPA: hypothetical protein VEI50_14620 [Nitrospiraceae bacterium]|nr:hypothetical protein [Nitrospiraceae bacterium]
MTVLFYSGLFLLSIVVTLGGCALFTNAIEWLGKRFNLSEGAVGSVLAALGTTLPETSIPIIAIFFGTGREQTEVGLGAILGAPFMLSTLVIPILATLLLVYARMGKRGRTFHLNYTDITVDLSFFSVAYGVAIACVFVSSRLIHAAAAAGLMGLYLYYMTLKFSENDEVGEGGIEPLIFSKASATPPYSMIGLQGVAGLIGLILGAHLFISAAETIAGTLALSPLILSLLVAPLATELPEMSNSFLWLYRKKDRLAVGNVTGAMVFQGTFPVSVGLLGTEWALKPTVLVTMVLAVIAATSCLLQAAWGGCWRPWLLGGSALLYIGYGIYLYGW